MLSNSSCKLCNVHSHTLQFTAPDTCNHVVVHSLQYSTASAVVAVLVVYGLQYSTASAVLPV
jgi:hypothetical protein